MLQAHLGPLFWGSVGERWGSREGARGARPCMYSSGAYVLYLYIDRKYSF